jgi:hypothetical protein
MRVFFANVSLLLATTSLLQADCPWGLWVEAPGGSDQWSLASGREIRFTAREDCQRRADAVNAFELAMHQIQGASGEARDVFVCLPCTVDPRTEAALRLDAGGVRGPHEGK